LVAVTAPDPQPDAGERGLPRLPAAAGSLAGVVPSLLADLGLPGFAPAPGGRLLPAGTRGVCLLLVDGLGWRLLRGHAADAPFLAALAAGTEPIAAGFPSTTAVSISTLGTGVPSGQHGVVGYTFAIRRGVALDALGWSTRDGGRSVDARKRFAPEQVQPMPTALERAGRAGARVRLAIPHVHRDSGLTRAVLRGGDFRGVYALGDLTVAALVGLDGDAPALSYAYHGDLDLIGHVYGPGTPPWRLQLSYVDRLVATIAEGLPERTALVVTADHGMVSVPEERRLDFDTMPELREGVRLLAGEPRARYVYAERGALADVRAAWTALLGDSAWVASRDEAIEAGWFGGPVTERARERIGDLVVAARSDVAVVRSATEPRLSLLVGQHGSLTADEQLIPLLVTGR
jgi:predicted AlkP superfamily pyrophosphatase or phosphodiesterase